MFSADEMPTCGRSYSILGVIVARLANVGFSSPISAIMTDGDKTNHGVGDAETRSERSKLEGKLDTESKL